MKMQKKVKKKVGEFVPIDFKNVYRAYSGQD